MITSKDNKIIKKINSLKNKKEREKTNLFIVEGKRFVSEIPNNWKVEFFSVSESFKKYNDIQKYEEIADIFIISDNIFNSISETKNSQGIIAVCEQKKYDISNFILTNGFYIILEELSDPGNLGTIIRTADACNVNGIFISKGSVDLYNSKVLRSTMGSIFHIPIFKDVEIKYIIEIMRKNNIKIYATHLKGENYIYDFDFKKGCSFIIGNEARGINSKTIIDSDECIKIPILGNAESLNASVAASVIMYEVVRQRIYS